MVEENALFAKIITIPTKINAFRTNALSLLRFLRSQENARHVRITLMPTKMGSNVLVIHVPQRPRFYKLMELVRPVKIILALMQIIETVLLTHVMHCKLF
jgi:hypothetical protein